MLTNILQELPPPPGAWPGPRASQLLYRAKINKRAKAFKDQRSPWAGSLASDNYARQMGAEIKKHFYKNPL